MSGKIDKLLDSYKLSKQSISGVINPLEIIELFENIQLKYILVGGHMLAYHTQNPRATVDVDFIIAQSDFNQAVALVQSNFPHLTINDKIQHVTFDDGHNNNSERIDLIRDDFPLFKQVLKLPDETSDKIKIPSIEAAITLKFAACISPNRNNDDKLIDQADLIHLIKATAKLNKELIHSLAEEIYLVLDRESIRSEGKSGFEQNFSLFEENSWLFDENKEEFWQNPAFPQ
ncbi:hypothetical protein MNBD_GAMMA01-1117 [hydrothermal vent metagenome]|uniref:Ync n=2 Tax=hydrothermal vent metagenome TaxID=652676 RepID=A0A3B0VQ88_9ZZZZ